MVNLNRHRVVSLTANCTLTEKTTLAIFSDIEFISNGIKHRFCYVKPTDENEGRFFISTSDSNEPIELKTLFTFKEDIKPLSVIRSKLKPIKILPYEFNMTRQTINNSITNNPIAPKEENSKFLKKLKSKKSSIIIGIDEQKRKLFFMIPFSHNEKLITAKFPEPISLYFNHSVELYMKSLSYRDMMVSGSRDDETILLQDDAYHKFLQYFVSSILMLHSAIELFINSSIKDSIEIEINGELLNKKELEQELTLSEKLGKVVPLISNFNLSSNKHIIDNLIDLNDLNDELQNLRTSDSINQPFLDTFEKLLKFKMEDCFESTKSLFKKVNKNYKLIEL